LVEKHRLNFEILHDEGNAFAEKLDLVHGFDPELKEIYLGLGADLAEVNGEPSWTLPVPARIAVGRDHRILLICSYLCGAAFLIVCDMVARTVIAPMELPVGVVTGMIGGILFIYALGRRKAVGD
jgi:iron complex transport system permease protein